MDPPVSGDVPVRTIVESMVGRSIDRMFPDIPAPGAEVVLEAQGLSGSGVAFTNVSFQVRAGEVFGIAGLIGAGRTDLVGALTGADPIAAGSVHFMGREITPRRPIDAIREGIVLVPEDRKLQGVVLTHSIEENVVYANFEFVSRGGWLDRAAAGAFVDDGIRRLGVKGARRQRVDELSGGNQQKVVLAKWLVRNPRVVVLDEPTRGIDVGARASIHDLIVALARTGVAVIVVSSTRPGCSRRARRWAAWPTSTNGGSCDLSRQPGVVVLHRRRPDRRRRLRLLVSRRRGRAA